MGSLHDTLAGANVGINEIPAMLMREYWEEVFAQEDPWDYGSSAYESWKFDRTLSVLPARRLEKALDLGCAEGHLTARLAPLVGHLTAIDISPTAIARACERCAHFDNVQFQILNLASDPLPSAVDLILCSEVLFYLPLEVLTEIAPKISHSLKLGGYLLLAHGNVIADDRTRTGFDWGHPFGAKAIGRVFDALDEIELIRELRTPLYTVQLFRRFVGSMEQKTAPKISEIPLPPDLVLSPEIEKAILWDGAVVTRDEARARETTAEIPILMYHSIADDGPPELAPYRVSPLVFREQLRYLRRHGFYSITLEEWAESIAAQRPLPGRPVILTFDDGYKDFMENAWPALERADFSATLFVVTERVGRTADWDELTAKPLPLMNWKELRELRDRGVEIGSHTATHKDLLTLSSAAVMAEARRARATLREKLDIEAGSIAFPWGGSNETVRRVLARCGYTAGVTTWGGHGTLAHDPMDLPRIEVFGDDDITAFGRKLKRNGISSGEVETLRGAKPDADPDITGFDPDIVGFDVDTRTPVTAIDMFSSKPAPFVRSAEYKGMPATALIAPQPPQPAGIEARAVGFDRESAPPARRSDTPIHPGYARAFASRLDMLIGEFVRLQTQLLNTLEAPITLQKTLTTLFTQPVTGKTSRAVYPGDEISPGIVLTFSETAEVILSIEPKRDHTLSPETYLNTIGLALTGPIEWLSLAVALDWSDLSLAERFQLCLFARPSGSVSCNVALRLPRQFGAPRDLDFATFELHPEDRNAIISGNLTMPDFIELDTTHRPALIFTFETKADLFLVMHYLNVYFA